MRRQSCASFPTGHDVHSYWTIPFYVASWLDYSHVIGLRYVSFALEQGERHLLPHSLCSCFVSLYYQVGLNCSRVFGSDLDPWLKLQPYYHSWPLWTRSYHGLILGLPISWVQLLPYWTIMNDHLASSSKSPHLRIHGQMNFHLTHEDSWFLWVCFDILWFRSQSCCNRFYELFAR